MHGQKGAETGEEEAVGCDDKRGALQVLELGMLDLAVDLSERFFAAHREHGVAEGHQYAEEAERGGEPVFPSEIPAHQD